MNVKIARSSSSRAAAALWWKLHKARLRDLQFTLTAAEFLVIKHHPYHQAFCSNTAAPCLRSCTGEVCLCCIQAHHEAHCGFCLKKRKDVC